MAHRRSLSTALHHADDLTSPRDRALARRLSYGVLRQFHFLEGLVGTLLTRPLRKRDLDIQLILMLGLHQILETRIPDYAAVAPTVSLCKTVGKDWATGVTNASLRRFIRERDSLTENARGTETARYSHPDWIIGRTREAWPHHWEQILDANNRHPEMSLRVNLKQGPLRAYLQTLDATGISATTHPFAPAALTLAEPMDPEALPGFAAGRVSVQDVAAQLTLEIIRPAPGLRILDSCAAPGGKTCHILESEPKLEEMVAVDVDPERCHRIRDNLRRLDVSATVINADAAAPGGWWDGRPFHRILLDAPCSATGVIRRHPDIKLLRVPTDIPALAATQKRLLSALWPLLARGGWLVYATCSFLPEENDDVIGAFASTHDVQVEPIPTLNDARPKACTEALTEVRPTTTQWGQATRYGVQILPGDEGMDGFYYARLRKP